LIEHNVKGNFALSLFISQTSIFPAEFKWIYSRTVKFSDHKNLHFSALEISNAQAELEMK
jgi:hypothetical protein